jgi:elongation factor G
MEEDPVLRLSLDPQTHEMLLSGMGQLHIEVVVGKLRRRYKVEINLKKPKIPYRETIKAAAEGHGRHKKQTGGHRQFGDCKVRLKPLPRGSDFKFVDDIFDDGRPRLLSHGDGPYDEVPGHLQDKLVAAARAEKGEVEEEG